jgi:DNA repair protein RecO (recombination protein O)
MIIRATAIPIGIHPYSSSSHIVHWLTRQQGKMSTLLKGALRPKSPFLGEYELFSTSELLYYSKRPYALHTGKECAILHRRDIFRTDWRAMQAASYLTALINRTTPEEAPQPGLFEFYETMLDLSAEHGAAPSFLFWSELRFCAFHGYAPNLDHCVVCSANQELRFCASQGGVVCPACAKEKKWPTLASPPDILAILRAWQKADHPGVLAHARLTNQQLSGLGRIAGTFMMYHFNIPPELRNAIILT